MYQIQSYIEYAESNNNNNNKKKTTNMNYLIKDIKSTSNYFCNLHKICNAKALPQFRTYKMMRYMLDAKHR